MQPEAAGWEVAVSERLRCPDQEVEASEGEVAIAEEAATAVGDSDSHSLFPSSASVGVAYSVS